jgi:acyl-CoA thioester hydrolase
VPAIYDYPHTVTADEIDQLGHANNVAYVEWLQSAAVAHSAAQGWAGQRYLDFGTGCVVRSHTITYLQPAHCGDQIIVQTWVATMRKASSLRRYHVLHAADGVLLAKAETLWACINYQTRQPVRIPREIAEAFTLVDRALGADA